MRRWLLPLAGLLLLAGCAGSPKREDAPGEGSSVPGPATSGTGRVSPYPAAQEDPATRGHYTAGGLYRPGVPDTLPDHLPDVDAIPEPEVVALPRSPVGNRSPYRVLGKRYTVLDDNSGYVETGTASYYGAKFHGRLTSNREVYDMYAFTAAHKSLPLPSFARVTNLDNGKSVVVRVNDRGPFHEGRVIDLSYAAAVKIGIHPAGTGRVEVRALVPESGAAKASAATPAAPPAAGSAMDAIVEALPAAAPAANPAPEQPAAGDGRFSMYQDGRVMTADDFDAWLATRGLKLENGRPVALGAEPDAVAEAAAPVAVAAEQPPAPTAPAVGGVTLQVAAFGARANAERALATLRSAGIADVALLDGVAAGKPVWRLRVGPVPATRVAALTSQVAGLGFGAPTIVRD